MEANLRSKSVNLTPRAQAETGVDGGPKTSFKNAVHTVDWQILGVCNLRCLHCYGPAKSEKPLPIEKMNQIIDKIHDLGAKLVVLTGGEPLMTPDIIKVLERLHGYGIKISFSTNTTFFTKFQTQIEEYVSSLNIPLDGSTAKIHAKSRMDEKTFESAINVFEYYKQFPERKPEMLRIGTVYSKANKGDLLKMSSLFEKYNDILDQWRIYELINTEYPAYQVSMRKEIMMPSEDFKSGVEELLRETKIPKNKIVVSYEERFSGYFLINPAGQLMRCTKEGGMIKNMPIADVLSIPTDKLLEMWDMGTSIDNYKSHVGHYSEIIKNI